MLASRRLALCLLLLVGACSGSPSPARGFGTPSGPGRDAQSAANSISRADGLFFSNRYTDAEAAYRDSILRYSWYAEGHAAFALFLNYQHRFSEAAGEVTQARSLDQGSAYAAAVDTRVHDWAAKTPAELKAAVAIGADAVRLGPGVALAHTFYAEALADTGDSAGAAKELDAANRLAQSAYEKSEVERERANLARDRKETAAELTHLKASQSLQPNWAERTRELAEYYFVNDQPDTAVALVRQAIAEAPNDPTLRLTLGAEALLRQDIPLADESLTAANTLKPHDPGTESTLAMTHYTLHHDAGEAEKLLRDAVADAPGNLDMLSLLDGFLRYVKRDTRAADAVQAGPPPRDPINPRAPFPTTVLDARQTAAQGALDALNALRAKAHLPPAHIDPRISSGATSHAYWWLFNLSLPDVKDLGIHKEVPGTPGYTGVNMRDRATHFGYPLASMAEDITHRGDPAGAIKDWVDSVYHRFPLMFPTLDAVGFGEALGGDLPIDVLDMSYLNEVGDRQATEEYPVDGQTDVPTAFLGNELPDPVLIADPAGKYPSGYPVTVNFNPYATVVVTTSDVRGDSGKAVDSYVLPPGPGFEKCLTILPKSPLSAHATYRVHVTGSIDGVAFTRDWSFVTES